MRFTLLTIWVFLSTASANYPVFEGSSQLKELLIPADVHIGSVIYRLRASDPDHDYPLQFDATDYGSYVVRVENLPCNQNSTFCEANVYLERVLMIGQNFKFRFTVRDTKGDTTTAFVSIEVTDAPVDITNIFPHFPGIIVLPENTKVNTELEYVVVRKSTELKKSAQLEVRGAMEVEFGRVRTSQETTTGIITLKKPLDFESKNMYKIQIFALDIYTDKTVDSRNIAGFEVIMIVEDVQDTPPIFIQIDPTTKLRNNLSEGDVITQVIAVDGDRGNPRQIIYGLVSEGNPFTIFFNIDAKTGKISLIKPLKQLTSIARSHQPILLTIMAEEIRTNVKEPAPMSTTVTVAFLLAEAGNTPPYFDNIQYVCHLDENSAQGTALVFSDAYSTQVHDDDMGKQGVFSLQLEGNNGTFEISPNVVERRAYFTIRVRNKLLLDYETRKSVHFLIVARELDPGSLSSTATVLVYLNDVNDNAPKFQSDEYTAQIPENATANTHIAEMKATDIDTDLGGRVHYTRITGYRNSSLIMNPLTGLITLATDNHGFDREESSEYRMTVEARDLEGTGLLATVPLVIKIMDVNDEVPIFENTPYHLTLTSDLKNFSVRAFVKANDKDAESPNNIVRYEIISGNYNNKFYLNSETGELQVTNFEDKNRIQRQSYEQPVYSSNVYALTVRAYDLGVPHLHSVTQVRIFPPDTGSRLLSFLVPAKGVDYLQLEDILIKITGAQVKIMDIKPYKHHVIRTRAIDDRPNEKEKSIVTARVIYGNNTMIDVESIYLLLHSTVFRDIMESNQVEYKTAESRTDLSWILLLLLILLLMIILTLLICNFWKCCPFYHYFKRDRKKSQVSDAAQTINFHNKSVQANRRLETRSTGDSNSQQKNWKFYQFQSRERQPIFLIPKDDTSLEYRNNTKTQETPTFMYTGQMPNMQQHEDVFIQDVPDTEYHTLDPEKLNVSRFDNKEYLIKKTYAPQKPPRKLHTTPADREEIYTKEGEAEILRLQSNEKLIKEQHQLLNQPDRMYDDKVEEFEDRQTDAVRNQIDDDSINTPLDPEILQRNEVESGDTHNSIVSESSAVTKVHEEPTTKNEVSQITEKEHKSPEPIRHKRETTDSEMRINEQMTRSMFDLSLEEQSRLASFQRDILLTRFLMEEQRKFSRNQVDTQSLPGSLSMGTQTDRHRATQTDVLCLLRPEPRKVKSENDDSSDSDRDYSRYRARSFSMRPRIRTPIMEESESLEGIKSTDNRSSLLRRANSKRKIDVMNGQQKDQKTLKKAVSYADIGHVSRKLLNEKEVYTPRSLKSRLIARRLSASEPRKISAHCSSHLQQDAKDRRRNEPKHFSSSEYSKKEDIVRKDSNNNMADDSNDDSDIDSPSSQCTLRLKSKNQQFLEKKSVFTIAYDDAATKQLEGSSNGSVFDKENV